MSSLETRHTNLLKALDDIAKGMVGKGLPNLDDRNEFRYKMWKWSQKIAREAVEADKVS